MAKYTRNNISGSKIGVIAIDTYYKFCFVTVWHRCNKKAFYQFYYSY